MNMRENYVEWTTITIQIMAMNGIEMEDILSHLQYSQGEKYY